MAQRQETQRSKRWTAKEEGEEMRGREEKWVLDYCRANPEVNALNGPAHDAFAAEFKAPLKIQIVGPNYCPRLMLRVRSLHKGGWLERFTIGISNGPGWPKWVYTYSLRSDLKNNPPPKQTEER